MTKTAYFHVLGLISGYQSTCLIIAAHQVGLFQALISGARQIGDLASELGVDPLSLSRFVRALESLELVQFEGRAVVLSEGGRLLAADGSSINSLPTLIGEQYLPAWANLSSTLRNGKPAFEQVFGVSVWRHRQEHPHLNAAFGKMIKELAANDTGAILNSYDFSGVQKIIDVGGGRGSLLIGILKDYEHITGVLFDQPHVMNDFLESIESDKIRKRCTAMGGSFFDSVPADGDLYILQAILHDWADDDCIRILETIRKSMVSGDKLLILERIIPANGVAPMQMAMLDMHMMAVLGGRERMLSEFDSLLEKAKLRRLRVISTAGFAADIIEAEIVG